MTDQTPASESTDIQDWVGPFWRRRWLILAIVALSTVGAYVLSAQREKRYVATSQVNVSNSSAQIAVSGTFLPPTDRDTQDQAQLLVSRRVSQRVGERLRLSELPQELVKSITVVPSKGSNFVSVTAERSSPRQAADVANAYVREYITSRRRQLEGDFTQAIRRLRGQLARLPQRDVTAQQRQDLQVTLRQLQAGRAVAPLQARQTVTATIPQAPVSPQPGRDALFALVISALMAVSLVIALERFDRRIKRPEDIPEIYRAPLLSTIPHTDDDPVLIEGGRAAVRYLLREPFRTLRTSLRLASPEKPSRLLTVTSAVPGEGKSTVVRNLALTYLEWGLSVVIMEADLRRPTMSYLFGLEPSSVGLTSVVTGEADLDAAMIEIPVDFAYLQNLDCARPAAASGAINSRGGADTGLRLMLLPSGPRPPNPPAVLSSDRTREVMERLANRFDVVLVDTPPLLPVSDAVRSLPSRTASSSCRASGLLIAMLPSS